MLLDLMMPVISGMEVLRRMKGDPVLRVIPVIVITADQEAETRSLGEGAIELHPEALSPEGRHSRPCPQDHRTDRGPGDGRWSCFWRNQTAWKGKQYKDHSAFEKKMDRH